MKTFIVENQTIIQKLNENFTTFKLHKLTVNNNINVSQSISTDYNKILVIDADCEYSRNIFNSTSNLNLFKGHTKWLFFGRDLNQILVLLKGQNINIDSKILVIVSKDKEKYEIYYLKTPALQRNGLIQVRLTGNYTPKVGLFYENPFNVIDYSMNGTVLKVTTCVRFFRSINLYFELC